MSAFEKWWLLQVEECEQGPTPEEETIARAAFKAGRAVGHEEGFELFGKKALQIVSKVRR